MLLVLALLQACQPPEEPAPQQENRVTLIEGEDDFWAAEAAQVRFRPADSVTAIAAASPGGTPQLLIELPAAPGDTGLFALDTPATNHLYYFPGDTGRKRYRSVAGQVHIEQYSANRLAGSFRASVVDTGGLQLELTGGRLQRLKVQ